ncbi:hypothetical protein JMJ35_006647 [Cladonia borealis]|uniref:Uncharacterized protein n=1 Tax=Cladonia borealis TaxID=184061 RepID=A0AA39V7W2_9LECA|nr:hypothetical protein JMJ35_006647 [Cladonia borealis]
MKAQDTAIIIESCVHSLYIEHVPDDPQAMDVTCRCKLRRACLANVQGWSGPQSIPDSCMMAESIAQKATPQGNKDFVIDRRLLRRIIDTRKLPEQLKAWAKERSITFGKQVLDDEERLKALQPLWTYRDLEASGIRAMQSTNLNAHRPRFKEGTSIHSAKQRPFTPDEEWWLRKFVLEGLEAGMYDRTVVADGRIFQWWPSPVLVKKRGMAEPRLIFNYHYVSEEPPGNHMELNARTHAVLPLPTHNLCSQFGLKKAYCVVKIHPDDRHTLAFSIPGIGRLQPTCMPQAARSSSFTMNEIRHIAFGAVPEQQPKSSLIYNPQPQEPPDMSFYNDIFPDHDLWVRRSNFLSHHLISRLSWARLCLSMSKVRIGMDRILALGETHEIGGHLPGNSNEESPYSNGRRHRIRQTLDLSLEISSSPVDGLKII